MCVCVCIKSGQQKTRENELTQFRFRVVII